MSEYVASDPNTDVAVPLEGSSGERIIYAGDGFLCPIGVDNATAEVICRYFGFNELVSIGLEPLENFPSYTSRATMSLNCEDSSSFWLDCKTDVPQT